ncbi:MAG TPA: RNA polymerase sigma factor [Vicinamibacterales bacterium]|nr:RNA polymerase sigma factor [Vicinamibacterales bacterium]HPW21980.1 RNA polymerase sigma factor [Vicinamibacterales bacterium]
MDRELAARCRRGEAGAFEELYKRHGRRVYTLAYRMTGSAADAEDLTQDVFLRAHRRLDSYRGEAALGSWLHRLTVNACLDYARGKHGRRQRVTDTTADIEAVEAAGRGPWRPGTALDPIDLERAVSQLPPSYRRAFLLHDVEGLEHHEIGEALGIAEGTSKSLVHKARMRLRVLLRGGSAGRPRPAAAGQVGAS